MPVRIILVDDHELLRTGLRLRLQREEGWQVVADVSSAEEAYTAIEREKPDLVVLDLDLPGDDGVTASGKIRARWPGIKILILTGSKPSSGAYDILQAGADGLVYKKETGDELVRATRVIMAGLPHLSPTATQELVRTLRNGPTAPTPSDGESVLSDRETAVLKGFADGKSYKEIASSMSVSVKSVETYRSRMMKKTGCSTNAELVRYAIREGIVKA